MLFALAFEFYKTYKMKKDALTYQVIGCCMKVHQLLGPGFQEKIYQRALSIELNRNGIAHKREQSIDIYYRDIKIGTRRADFVIREKLVIEIKATVRLEDVHLAQAKNYVIVYDFPLGLLVNFGSKSLQYNLVFNPKRRLDYEDWLMDSKRPG